MIRVRHWYWSAGPTMFLTRSTSTGQYFTNCDWPLSQWFFLRFIILGLDWYTGKVIDKFGASKNGFWAVVFKIHWSRGSLSQTAECQSLRDYNLLPFTTLNMVFSTYFARFNSIFFWCFLTFQHPCHICDACWNDQDAYYSPNQYIWSYNWIYFHIDGYFVASELKDPIWHSLEWQIGSFSSEATIYWRRKVYVYVCVIKMNNVKYICVCIYNWKTLWSPWFMQKYLSVVRVRNGDSYRPCFCGFKIMELSWSPFLGSCASRPDLNWAGEDGPGYYGTVACLNHCGDIRQFPAWTLSYPWGSTLAVLRHSINCHYYLLGGNRARKVTENDSVLTLKSVY